MNSVEPFQKFWECHSKAKTQTEGELKTKAKHHQIFDLFLYCVMVYPRPFECGFKKKQHLRFSRRYAIERCKKYRGGTSDTIFYGNTRTVSLDKMYIIFKCPQMIHMAKIKPLIAAT